MIESDCEDAVLWQRAAAGDAACFAVLFDRHADAVYRHLRGLVGADAAEDLTGAVFTLAWQRGPRVTVDERGLRPWLLATAGNLARNQTRATRRYTAAVARLAPEADEPDPADEANDRLDADTAAREARAALRLLPAHERDAVHATAAHLGDSAAAAAALGVPAGTLKSRLSRGRRRLRALLQAPPGDHHG